MDYDVPFTSDEALKEAQTVPAGVYHGLIRDFEEKEQLPEKGGHPFVIYAIELLSGEGDGVGRIADYLVFPTRKETWALSGMASLAVATQTPYTSSFNPADYVNKEVQVFITIYQKDGDWKNRIRLGPLPS